MLEIAIESKRPRLPQPGLPFGHFIKWFEYFLLGEIFIVVEVKLSTIILVTSTLAELIRPKTAVDARTNAK